MRCKSTPRERVFELVNACFWCVVFAVCVYQFASPDAKSARVFARPLTTWYTNPATGETSARLITKLTPVLFCVGFASITALFHFARFFSDVVRHTQAIVHRSDVLMYVEYGMSSTMMLVAISMISGVTAIETLVPVIVGNFSVMILGLIAEALSTDYEATKRSCMRSLSIVAHALSWLVWFAVWTPSGVSFFVTLSSVDSSSDVPAFVYLIWGGMFGLHFGFPAVFMWRSITDLCPCEFKICRAPSYDVTRLFVNNILSVTNKVFLVSMVAYAHLQLDPDVVSALPDLSTDSGYSELSIHVFVCMGYSFVALAILHFLDRRVPGYERIKLSGTLTGKSGFAYLFVNAVPCCWVLVQSVFDAGERAWAPGVLMCIYLGTQSLYVICVSELHLCPSKRMFVCWAICQYLSLAAFLALVIVNFVSPVYDGAYPWNRVISLLMGIFSVLLQTVVDGGLIMKYLWSVSAGKPPKGVTSMSVPFQLTRL